MSNDAEQTKPVAPYIPWQTFESFLERLKQTVIPTHIDPSVMRHMSGTAQSQTLSALRFLGLVEQDGTVTEAFKDLVSAYKGPKWKAEIGKLLSAAYQPVIGKLDVKNATPDQLKNRFRNEGGVEGDTVEKSIRFYLMGLKEAGIEFSPLVKIRQRAPRGTGAARRATAKKNGELGAPEQDEIHKQPEGTVRLPFAFPDKPMTTIHLAKGISEMEWAMIDTYVRNYIQLGAGKEEK